MTNYKKYTDNYDKNYTDIDPSLYLTCSHLPLLKQGLQYIDKENIKQFLQEIVETIERTGKANSNDIKYIIEKLNISILGIHTGILSSGGPGLSITFPHAYFSFCAFYFGPGIIGYWEGYNFYPNFWEPALTKINFIKKYEGSHKGYIFGFMGFCSGGGMSPISYYSIIRFGVLIIVTN